MDDRAPRRHDHETDSDEAARLVSDPVIGGSRSPSGMGSASGGGYGTASGAGSATNTEADEASAEASDASASEADCLRSQGSQAGPPAEHARPDADSATSPW